MPKRYRQLGVNEGLVHGPYMVAKVGFEPVTLHTELTTDPPCPTFAHLV